MKTRFSIVLTALLMLFGTSASAQVKGDLNGDGKVNSADVVELVGIIMSQESQGDDQQNQEPTVTDDATVTVSVTNSSNRDMTMSGMFRFVVCAAGGTGQETSAAWLNGENVPVTIPAGQTLTFPNIVIPNGVKDFSGWHFASDAEKGNYASNVIFYDAGTFLPDTYVPDMVASSTIFQNDGNYNVVFSKNAVDNTGQNNPSQDDQQPVNPPSGSNISVTLNLVNVSGSTVSLDGELRFVLNDLSTSGRLSFNTGGVTLAPNVVQQVVVSGNIGGLSPLAESSLSQVGYLRNVLFYVGGNSEVVLANNMSSDIVFQNGGTYDIYISTNTQQQQNEPVINNPTPNPPPSGAPHSVVSFNLSITNASGVSRRLDGDVVFVLGNPDRNGNYFGSYTGPYLRTDHIYFSSPVTLAPGETRIFGGISWVDGDTGYGMGEMSPANDWQITISERRSNVLLYVNGNSEVVICDRMPSSTVFTNGETYQITFR